MRIMREETFGPVLPVMPFDSDEEAIRLANDSEYGLAASVWTRDRARGEAVARRIQAGTVMVNDVISCFGISEAPHGGVKASGSGRSHGRFGLEEMVRTKYLDSDRLARDEKDLVVRIRQGFRAPDGRLARSAVCATMDPPVARRGKDRRSVEASFILSNDESLTSDKKGENMTTSIPDPKRELLRHTVATLAYRGGKALRNVPAGFADFRGCESGRSAGQILAHLGDLLDWGLSIARGQQTWKIQSPCPGRKEPPASLPR